MFQGSSNFYAQASVLPKTKRLGRRRIAKKISDTSGHFLVVSGYLLEESGKKKEEGDLKEIKKSFMGAEHFSEMAVISGKI